MRRLSWRRAPMLAAAALAVATTIGGAAPAQAAVPVSQVGWWTRSPSPPTVPDGGIAVGVAPDGNVTVAAIQLDTGGGASQAKVSIKEADGQAGGQAASLQVCTTSDEWSAAKGDALDQAPRATCSAQPVLLTRGDDGTWTADVTSLVASQQDKASLMILPAPSPAPVPGVQPAAYQLSFNAPTVDGTVLPAADDSSSSSASSSSSEAFSGSTATDSSSASSFTAPSYSVEPPPAAPASEAPTAIGPVPPPTSSADSSASRGSGSSSLPAAALAARAGGSDGPSGAAALGIVLLSLLVGGMAATGRWAMQSGLLDRLTPGGGGGMLPPPE